MEEKKVIMITMIRTRMEIPPHKLAENGGHLYNLLVKLSEEKKIYRNGDYFFIDKEAIARKIARLKRRNTRRERKSNFRKR